MASVKSIRQRVKSVRNTAQITKAMEVVSATKMRRSQEFAFSARPFAVASLEMLYNLFSRTSLRPALLQSRPVSQACLLLVASDKGLAGAFNAHVFKKTEQWLLWKKTAGISVAVVAVGKKAREYAERKNARIIKSFTGFGDYSMPKDTLPIAELVINGFLDGSWDEVASVSMNFRTTLVQETIARIILPATEQGIQETVNAILPERGKFATDRTSSFPLPSASASATSIAPPSHKGMAGHSEAMNVKKATADKSSLYSYEYKFEPSADELLNVLVPQLIRTQIHHIILESNASEHSARMVAMKNASDNARELISDLTMLANKARQAGITAELTEITAGKEALEE